MQKNSPMQNGWTFAASIIGANVGADMGESYVEAVEAAIKQLEKNINNHQYRSLGIGQLQGYMLEEFSAGTFNVDAAAAGSADRAEVLHSNGKDSVDIHLASGKDISAKSYISPEKTAKAQARLTPETGKPSYYNQERLIPSDQLAGARAAAHQEALRNKPIRADVSEAYSEAEYKLTDIIKNEEGVSSKSASRNELEKIAGESQRQDFKAEEHGISVEYAIKTEYLLKQALKAGYTAATITVVMQLAPEIYKAIDFLVKHGEINVQQIKQIGQKGISAGAEGFLRGSIASSLKTLCDAGMLGEVFKDINPTLLGTVVALVMQTVKNSILVAAGKMTTRQMGAAFVDSVVVSGGYLIGAHIGGIIGQALGFELPVVGYLLGSLIGTSFCVLYNIGKKKLISFCVDTGFTCFGLVEQNYELPEEVMDELGVKTIPIQKTQIARTTISRTQPATAPINQTDYETIDIKVLRRGVIGVNKIGYVLES